MSRFAKPGYTFTRWALRLSLAGAWAVIGALVLGALAGSNEAVALAAIAIPSMVALIAALLGIHRAFGTADLKILSKNEGEP